MDTVDLRTKLIKEVGSADERLLVIVNAVFESYKNTQPNKETVAYTVHGKPLTREEYVKLNDQAEAEYQRGEYLSHDDVKEQFRTRKRA